MSASKEVFLQGLSGKDCSDDLELRGNINCAELKELQILSRSFEIITITSRLNGWYIN